MVGNSRRSRLAAYGGQLVDPVTVPGPLNEDGIAFLISCYLPDHIGEAGSGGDVFCAHEMYGWEQQADTIAAWLWVYCEEFFMEAEGQVPARPKAEGSGFPSFSASH
jgi:hypothetical protein